MTEVVSSPEESGTRAEACNLSRPGYGNVYVDAVQPEEGETATGYELD